MLNIDMDMGQFPKIILNALGGAVLYAIFLMFTGESATQIFKNASIVAGAIVVANVIFTFLNLR